MDPASPPDLSADVEYFRSIPWVARHISTSGWTPCPIRCLEVKPDTEDSLFSTTLQTPSTLANHLCLAKAPSIPLPPSILEKTSGNLPIPACKTFWELGDGLNGFPKIAHGGLLAALLDEQMGMLLTVNGEWGGKPTGQAINEMTVFMNVKYKAPVETPGVVMVVAECTKRDGRKTFVTTRLYQKDIECACAEGLFIEVPATRL